MMHVPTPWHDFLYMRLTLACYDVCHENYNLNLHQVLVVLNRVSEFTDLTVQNLWLPKLLNTTFSVWIIYTYKMILSLPI